MKKTLLLSFILFLFSFLSQAQTWSEPFNISNMEGSDYQPHIAIDKNGIIHCVWSHTIDVNFRKIYYSKSEDDGLTWSEPYDVSQNDEKWLATPKIVADTNNKLYLTYQHNVGNYYNTVNVLQTCENGVWSDYDTITGGQLGVVKNFLAIDNNNHLYAFWYWGQTTFYRHFENGEWSEIFNADVGTGGKPFIMDVVADINNNLHCLFMFRNNGQPSDSTKVAYRKLLPNNSWSELEILSSSTNSDGGKIGIDVDTLDFPHTAFREVIPWGIAPKPDTTIYRFKDGDNWTTPDVIVTDPKNQMILIDGNNKPNVFDVEKLGDNNSMLVHHFKEYSWWESIVIYEIEYGSISYCVEKNGSYLFIAYSKIYEETGKDIVFSKTSLLTKTNRRKNHPKFDLKLFPNPFNNLLNISFETEETSHVSVKIHEYNGKIVKTIFEKQLSKGMHQLNWNGTDNNGNTVPAGQYILRLRQGKRIVSKPVNFIE